MLITIIGPSSLLLEAQQLAVLLDSQVVYQAEEPVARATRRPCDLETLYAGGEIACELGWAMAARLGVPVQKIGVLVQMLDIKVRHCSLGCFA